MTTARRNSTMVNVFAEEPVLVKGSTFVHEQWPVQLHCGDLTLYMRRDQAIQLRNDLQTVLYAQPARVG